MRVYFMGICGTAMGNAALLLREQGHEVSGADAGVYPPMSDVLAEAEIEVFDGYDADRLEKLQPDLVVIGNALSRGNPEVEWLLETRRFSYTSLPALLGEIVLNERRNIVVTGTHGKTTTTTMTAYLLRENGEDPGYVIGGVPLDLPAGSASGSKDSPFVIEGDEYDSAFFDKRSKFIHYKPDILAINNVEFDHGDIFRDLDDVKRTFSHLLRIVPRNGFVLTNGDDANVQSLLPVSWTTTVTVGEGEHCDLRIVDFSEDAEGARFSLVWRGEEWAEVEWSLHGIYNARNAAMAGLAAGLSLYPGDPTQIRLESLARFKGVKRRQEILYDADHLKVIEDFGHHPTAIAQTLGSLRTRYPEFRLVACFEPRSNTACTNVFQDEFFEALRLADEVFIGAVNRAERYADEERLDTALLVRNLNDQDISAQCVAENKQIYEALLKSIPVSNDGKQIICFLSNGSFDGISYRLVDEMKLAT